MRDADMATLFDVVAREMERLERAARVDEPSLAEPDVRERALRRARAALRQDVSRETLAYLRWRVELAAAAARTRAAAAALRAVTAQTRASIRGQPAAPGARSIAIGGGVGTGPEAAAARTFLDADHRVWSVHELDCAAMPWARAARRLVFQCEDSIRRVWSYPANWRVLADPELERLSWRA